VVQRDVEGVGCAGAVWVGVCDDLFYGVWGVKKDKSSLCQFLALGVEKRISPLFTMRL
jgi:hypothetical protein